jgi:hypothetical protein
VENSLSDVDNLWKNGRGKIAPRAKGLFLRVFFVEKKTAVECFAGSFPGPDVDNFLGKIFFENKIKKNMYSVENE